MSRKVLPVRDAHATAITPAGAVTAVLLPGKSQIESYLQGLAPGSRRTLELSLLTLARSLEQQKLLAPGWDWADLTGERVRQLRQGLAEHYAPATVNKMLAALRGLMRTYRRQGLIDELRYQGIAQVGPMSDRRRTPSRTLTEREITALLRGCDRDITAAGRRDAALLTLLLTGGLRSEEVVELEAADVDLRARRFHVRSSVKEHDRWLKLDAAGSARLKAWLAIRGDWRGALLNPVDKGGTIRPRRLTSTALLGILARRAQSVGLTALTTRDLRRTCIVRLIAAGLDLEQVRQRVGHLSWLTRGAYRELASELKRPKHGQKRSQP